MRMKRLFEGWYWKRKRIRLWASSKSESPIGRPDLAKLNIGAGVEPIPGWTNQDLIPHPGIDVVSDADDLSSIPDESFDVVRASHIVEHIYCSDLKRYLDEWMRVLKPGGWLVICVPDFRCFVQSYLDDPKIIDVSTLPMPIDWENATDHHGYLVQALGGWFDRDHNPHMKHRMVYDRDSLENVLRNVAGAVEVREFDFRNEEPFTLGIEDNSTNLDSLNLMARKPVRAETEASPTSDRETPLTTASD